MDKKIAQRWFGNPSQVMTTPKLKVQFTVHVNVVDSIDEVPSTILVSEMNFEAWADKCEMFVFTLHDDKINQNQGRTMLFLGGLLVTDFKKKAVFYPEGSVVDGHILDEPAYGIPMGDLQSAHVIRKM